MRLERSFPELPTEADIRAELERVVAGPGLTKSPQLAKFLRFVVEAVLTGNGHQIKAYTVATDGLGRDAGFDPVTDPIVRVEARRLRRALNHHYANGGHGDPIVIELPRGSYVPVFHAKAASRRAIARGRGLWAQIGDALRGNSRLVLLVVVVTTVVGLGFDLLEVKLASAVSPRVRIARQVAVQPPMSPDAAGLMVP